MKLELNIPEGREFKIGNAAQIYRFNEEGILKYKHSGLPWQHSFITFNSINNCEITLLPWKPQEGEKYYYIDPSEIRGYAFECCSQPYDKRIISRVTVYQTKEEVKAAVKELVWIVE